MRSKTWFTAGTSANIPRMSDHWSRNEHQRTEEPLSVIQIKFLFTSQLLSTKERSALSDLWTSPNPFLTDMKYSLFLFSLSFSFLLHKWFHVDVHTEATAVIPAAENTPWNHFLTISSQKNITSCFPKDDLIHNQESMLWSNTWRSHPTERGHQKIKIIFSGKTLLYYIGPNVVIK